MAKLLRSTQESRPNLSRVFSVLRSACVGVACIATMLPASADDSGFSLRGFGTLGVARTNANDVEYVRDLSQSRGVGARWSGQTDSLLGVQASYRFGNQLDGVVQAVSRYRYDRTYTPDVTLAFLKYDPTTNVSLRAGRLGTEFFMLSDSRLVGYSYLTVRPPADFFWSLPFYSIEGADVVVSLPLAEAVLRGKVFSGISHEKVGLADELWQLGGSRMSGTYIDYLDGPWTLRASFAEIRFSNNLPIDKTLNALPGATPAGVAEVGRYLAAAGTKADYYSLGLVYDRGPWQFQLMLNQLRQGGNSFERSSAQYALVGYRIGAVTPFVGFSQVASKKSAVVLSDAWTSAVAARFVADSHVDQRTWMLGARWDVAHNVALKVQLDAIRGVPSSIFPYRQEKPTWSGNMNVLSATLDFVF